MFKDWWDFESEKWKGLNSDVRCAIIKSWAAEGSKPQPTGRRLAEDYAPILVDFLNDEDGKIREETVKTFGAFRIKYYAKYIVELLKDKQDSVRAAAVWALDQMDARECAKEIEKLKFDNSSCPYWLRDKIELSIGELCQKVLKKWTFIDKKTDTAP